MANDLLSMLPATGQGPIDPIKLSFRGMLQESAACDRGYAAGAEAASVFGQGGGEMPPPTVMMARLQETLNKHGVPFTKDAPGVPQLLLYAKELMR